MLTSSASVLALVFGLTVLVTGKDAVFASHAAVWVLCASLLFFVLAAGFAIVVQAHMYKYEVVSKEYLASLAASDTEWSQSADHAVRSDVSQKVRTLGSLRDGNKVKAVFTIVGLWLQMGAIALLAVSIGLEFYSRLKGRL